MTHAADVDCGCDAGRGVYVLSLSRTQTCCAHQHQGEIAQLSQENATNTVHKTERRELYCYVNLLLLELLPLTLDFSFCCYFFLARESTIAFFKFLHSFVFVHLFTSLALTRTPTHTHTRASE